MIIKHDVSQIFYVLYTHLISQKMHVYWKSWNKSALRSMKYKNVVLADTIVATIVHTKSCDILFD